MNQDTKSCSVVQSEVPICCAVWLDCVVLSLASKFRTRKDRFSQVRFSQALASQVCISHARLCMDVRGVWGLINWLKLGFEQWTLDEYSINCVELAYH